MWYWHTSRDRIYPEQLHISNGKNKGINVWYLGLISRLIYNGYPATFVHGFASHCIRVIVRMLTHACPHEPPRKIKVAIWWFPSTEKKVIVHDTECPYWDKVSLKDTKLKLKFTEWKYTHHTQTNKCWENANNKTAEKYNTIVLRLKHYYKFIW